MRETRLAQISIFENYAKHGRAEKLKQLSSILDNHPEILDIIKKDLVNISITKTGRKGLTVENIFRCLLLKQQLQVSYDQLAFHLCDSMSYRTFTRLTDGFTPKKSALQSTIRSISPETLEQVQIALSVHWLKNGDISLEKIRADSTVVKSNITPPSDSQLLNDSIRVLSRLFAKSRDETGIKLRFTDQRKISKSLAFSIFNAKNAEKEVLYPKYLRIAHIVLKQAERALDNEGIKNSSYEKSQQWLADVEYYKKLLLKVIDQTQRRVIQKEKVPASEKIVSIFEEHTDIIIKGFRNVQYGHKINLSSEKNGFITYLSIEDGNPKDTALFLPVINAHQQQYDKLPKTIVCDGGYASKSNVEKGRAMGVKRVVFHKRVGISYTAMGVKIKTFKKLRDFRAGVEGNISELKRSFCASKALWKGHDGFKAFVWSSVISYNLVRLARLQSG